MSENNNQNIDTTSLGNDYAVGSVPLSQRRGFYGTAAVWVGWCISLSAFMTGGTIGAGNDLKTGLLAVLAGNGLLFLIGSLCGLVRRSAPAAPPTPCLRRSSAQRALSWPR